MILDRSELHVREKMVMPCLASGNRVTSDNGRKQPWRKVLAGLLSWSAITEGTSTGWLIIQWTWLQRLDIGTDEKAIVGKSACRALVLHATPLISCNHSETKWYRRDRTSVVRPFCSGLVRYVGEGPSRWASNLEDWFSVQD